MSDYKPRPCVFCPHLRLEHDFSTGRCNICACNIHAERRRWEEAAGLNYSHHYDVKWRPGLPLTCCAGCGHPKYKHVTGDCTARIVNDLICDCRTYTERAKASYHYVLKENPMPDFTPLPEDVRHAAKVLEALDRQAGEEICGGGSYHSDLLFTIANQMEEEQQKAKRRRDKMFMLASDIQMAQNEAGEQWSVYQVADKLLDAGWDMPDTEKAGE